MSERRPTLTGRLANREVAVALRSRFATIRGRVGAIVPSRWLVIAVLMLDSLLILSAFFGAHYFGIDIASTIAYPPVDQHCQVLTEGIGNHCFSDYSIFSNLVLDGNPWSNNGTVFVNYLAGGLLPHLIFATLGHVAGNAHLGLIAYLIALTAAVVTPAVWATWRKPVEHKIVFVSLFGILSVPGLAALDRGNTIAFAIPAMLFFIVGVARDRPVLIAASITIAALVKPQYVLLIVAIIIVRKWKAVLVTIAGLAASNLLAYLFWPTALPGSLIQSIKNAATFGGTYIGSITEERAQTVSFSRGLFVVEKVMRKLLGLDVSSSLVLSTAAAAGLAAACVLLIILYFTGRAMSPALLACFVLAISSMVLTTSYSYYAVFALPIAAVVVRGPSEMGGQEEQRAVGILDHGPQWWPLKVATTLTVVSLAMTVTRVILPVLSSTDATQLQTSTTLVPILWTLTIVVSAFAYRGQHRKTLLGRPLPGM